MGGGVYKPFLFSYVEQPKKPKPKKKNEVTSRATARQEERA